MEKQLLSLLDFDLRITETHLASSLHDFLQIQAPISIQSSSTASASVQATNAHGRHVSSMAKVDPMSMDQHNSGKQAFSSLIDNLAEPTHDHVKRRPSLPNQPCLEEGEVMPVYKGRDTQDQYPSPDDGMSRLEEAMSQTYVPETFSGPTRVSYMLPPTRSVEGRGHSDSGYGSSRAMC